MFKVGKLFEYRYRDGKVRCERERKFFSCLDYRMQGIRRKKGWNGVIDIRVISLNFIMFVGSG